jgi:hypothetical protein
VEGVQLVQLVQVRQVVSKWAAQVHQEEEARFLADRSLMLEQVQELLGGLLVVAWVALEARRVASEVWQQVQIWGQALEQAGVPSQLG